MECSFAGANGPGSGGSWLAQECWRCWPPPSKRKTYFFPSLLCFAPTKDRVRGGPAFAQPPGVPGGACAKRAGAGWRGGCKGSDLPRLPGFLPAFLACPRLAHLSEFLRTFRQRTRPAATESGALAPGGLGLAVEGQAPGKKRKKHFSHPGPETRRDAQCQRLDSRRERPDRLGGRTLQTNPVFPARLWASLVAQRVKNLPAGQETRARPLGWEDPLEESVAIQFSILAWRIPMDRGVWRATSLGSQESDTTEQLRLTYRSHPRSPLGPGPQPPAQGLTHGSGLVNTLECTHMQICTWTGVKPSW